MDYNIIIKNGLSSGGSSGAKKLSAKTSSKENKTTIKNTQWNNNVNIRKIEQETRASMNAGLNFSHGNINSMVWLSGKMANAIGVVNIGLQTANKIGNFVIDYQYSISGESMHSHNAKSILKTVVTLGGNIISGGLYNEIFQKNIIRRKNQELVYGQELYNLNNYGLKYKVR